VRLLRIGLIGLVAVPFAAVAGGKAAPPPPPGSCRAPVRAVPVALPAPLTIRTSCGAFRIARDGTVGRISADPSPVPQGVAWWTSVGVWARVDRGHLVVGRWHRTLWRSTGRFAHAYRVGDIALDVGRLAFSYGDRASRLYVAKLGAPERPVARDEYPLGWTSGGLYVAGHKGAILLRSGSNALRIPRAKMRWSAYDQRTRSLYYVGGGWLLRAHGSRVQRVADLARYGITVPDRSLRLQLLGRLVALVDAHRLVVLRPDGAVFASTRLAIRNGHSDSISGEPTASPRNRVVAFAVMHPDHRIETQVFERGVESVYLLRPGSRAAVAVHTKQMWFNVCGHGANLSWRGSWLLYSAGEGSTALIDTRRGRTIGLSSLVRRLPGFKGDDAGSFGVSWG
jgi:hypothetical protein